MLDIGLYILYTLLAIAVAAAVIFPILHAFREPKALMKSGIGIAIVVVVFGLCYAFADSKVTLKWAALGTTETSSKLIGAGLNMFFVALVGAVLALIYSEVSKAFK